MIRLKKYINNVSALQFIQLLRFATLFLIGVVFTRYYTKTQIGHYETLLFIASLVSFFWLQGILQSFLSLVKTKDNKKSADYFNSFLLLLLFSVFAVIFLLIFKHSTLQQFDNSSNSSLYFYLLLAFVFFNTPAFFIEYLFLTLHKAKAIFIYGVWSYGLQFVLLALPPLLGFSLLYSIYGLVIINVIRFIYLLLILKKHAVFKFDISFIRTHLKLATPLIGSALLSGSSQYIDGVLVTHFFDTETFAIFRYGAREFPIILIMANALSNSLIPVFSNTKLADALAQLKKNAQWLMHLMFPTTFILLGISNWLFPIFYTADFAFAAKIFNVYLLLIVSRLLFPQTILIGKKQNTILLTVSIIELVVNVSLSLLFLHWFGIIGVALATLVANITDKALLMFFVYKKLQILPNKYLNVGWYVVYSFLLLAWFYVVDYILFA